MMMPENVAIPAGPARKKELLLNTYEVYSGWISLFPLACRKGCAACCTRSVAVSSLEGQLLLDFVQKNNREEWLRQRLAQAEPEKDGNDLSMNRFAAACLEQRQTAADFFAGWDFGPCVFLEHDTCAIYEARPFGCRSFGSLVRCSEEMTAELAPIHLAVNTVFTQIVEHLSSDGGLWGKMTVILQDLLKEEEGGGPGNLQLAHAVPGFLLEPRETRVVYPLLLQLRERSGQDRIICDLIDNFMLME